MTENKQEADKWEERAKKFDTLCPNLAKALRSQNLQQSCADIEKYGWIRASLPPKDGEQVLVTDGKEVWIGDYNSSYRNPKERWALVYDGAPPFNSTEIIAWTYMPHVPPELLTELSKPQQHE